MELTLAEVAVDAGVSLRSLQRGVISGALSPCNRRGAKWTVDGKAGRAFARSRGRGRLWGEARKTKAREAWSAGTFRWDDSAEQLAHLWGGLGGWQRLSGEDIADLSQAGVDVVGDELGVWGNSWFTCVRVGSFDELENRQLVPDPWGNVGVLVRSEEYAILDAILDAFMLGDARESNAARELIETRHV